MIFTFNLFLSKVEVLEQFEEKIIIKIVIKFHENSQTMQFIKRKPYGGAFGVPAQHAKWITIEGMHFSNVAEEVFWQSIYN